eukprot:4188253-Alexandrium_andersonii.AAC.1
MRRRQSSSPKAVPGQLRFGHPEPVGDLPLHCRGQHAAHLGNVEPCPAGSPVPWTSKACRPGAEPLGPGP